MGTGAWSIGTRPSATLLGQGEKPGAGACRGQSEQLKGREATMSARRRHGGIRGREAIRGRLGGRSQKVNEGKALTSSDTVSPRQWRCLGPRAWLTEWRLSRGG